MVVDADIEADTVPVVVHTVAAIAPAEVAHTADHIDQA